MKKYFVTTSLPYANGPLHLGHMLEHIQADIWVRFQRMMGHEVVFVSGDDAHGSAIMLSAEQKKMDPEAYTTDIWRSHFQDLQDASIQFDHYHTTRSEENRNLVNALYQKLEQGGALVEKSITQAYDQEKKMFLPDRYIKGTCPKCGAKDQYGDHCEVCGATYAPEELKEAYSTLTRTAPALRETEHVFFQLSRCSDILAEWLEKAELQDPVRNKLKEWLTLGLVDWDITRDGPYFGFEIPGRSCQYFYVWMDAPVGYMAALSARDRMEDRSDCQAIWQQDSTWEVWHFIGKDIINFHGIFWPSVLKQSGHRTPTGLHVHGFLTINGEKMSKSRGTFVTAREFLDRYSSEYLRYYFAAKLSDSVSDIDLNWADFSSRCNADLVGKIVNIGSRSASFIHKYFSGAILGIDQEEPVLKSILEASEGLQKAYFTCATAQVVREVMALSDNVNQYIDSQKPWLLAKDPTQMGKVHEVCSVALHAFGLLMTYLSPVLPETGAKVAQLFGRDTLEWRNLEESLTSCVIAPFPRLLERVDFSQWQTEKS